MSFKKVIACCILCSCASSVLSMEYEYAIRASVTGSDNISRAIDGESGNSINTGFNFQINSLADSELVVDFSGELLHQKFSEDDISDRQIKQVTGNFEYQPKRSNFSLQLLQELSQEPQNRFEINDVNNIRDSRTLSIIPGYFVQLNPLNTIHFNYVYTNSSDEGVEIEDGFIDASRKTGEYSLSYERQLSSTQQLFIGANSLRIDFNEQLLEGGVDFDQDDIFARWVLQGRATRVQILYGLSTVYDVLGNEFDADISEFSITRQINQTHSIEFNFGTGFDSELSENYSTDTINLDSQTSNFLSAQEVETYNLIYLITTVSDLNMNLSISNTKINGTLENNQEEQRSFSLDLTYPISRIISFGRNNAEIGLSYRGTENTFDTSLSDVTENDSSVLSITYNQFVSSNVSMFVELSSYKSDGVFLGSFMADSKSITIGIQYAPSGRF